MWEALRPHCVVFGRAKPDSKIGIVREFQSEHESRVVAMCGDGGNDAGALKQAHIGIALVHGGAELGYERGNYSPADHSYD